MYHIHIYFQMPASSYIKERKLLNLLLCSVEKIIHASTIVAINNLSCVKPPQFRRNSSCLCTYSSSRPISHSVKYLGILEKFAKFTRKHVCWSRFFNRVAALIPEAQFPQKTQSEMFCKKTSFERKHVSQRFDNKR